MKFDAIITTILAAAFATSEARISEKRDTKERRLDGEWGSAGSMSMPMPVALDSVALFENSDTSVESIKDNIAFTFGFPGSSIFPGSNINPSSLSSAMKNLHSSKSGKMPNYEINRKTNDIFYSNAFMKSTGEDFLINLGAPEIWQNKDEAPDALVGAGCNKDYVYVWTAMGSSTEKLLVYISYPNFETKEIEHLVGITQQGFYGAGLLFYANKTSGVLNQAGVGAITAVGMDSGKTYYIGLEGESFIGTGNEEICFLSGVVHVYG